MVSEERGATTREARVVGAGVRTEDEEHPPLRDEADKEQRREPDVLCHRACEHTQHKFV